MKLPYSPILPTLAALRRWAAGAAGVLLVTTVAGAPLSAQAPPESGLNVRVVVVPAAKASTSQPSADDLTPPPADAVVPAAYTEPPPESKRTGAATLMLLRSAADEELVETASLSRVEEQPEERRRGADDVEPRRPARRMRFPTFDADDETLPVQIQLTPPGPERVFRLESEANFQERVRQEAERPVEPPVVFPAEPLLSTQRYTHNPGPRKGAVVEPNYVCYGRLYFNERNSERYGWDLGIIQPFLSAGIFYWDVATLPYHIGTEPCRKHECSAGYCLPGDPVPYMLYPPRLSLTGAVLEAGTIVALYAIFPG